MPQDVTGLVIPLWPALVASGGIIMAIAGTIVWVFANFDLKKDAHERHLLLEGRVSSQEKVLNDVAQNVSYIRGRLEPK